MYLYNSYREIIIIVRYAYLQKLWQEFNRKKVKNMKCKIKKANENIFFGQSSVSTCDSHTVRGRVIMTND